ncbi:hypothetical protein Q2366_26325, partial [Escherichia coli]|nr:hypothetical protein [Escherichia coli]
VHFVISRTGRVQNLVYAVYCLQSQWEKPVRLAALTSRAFHCDAHYTVPGMPQVLLALPSFVNLPVWFAAF